MRIGNWEIDIGTGWAGKFVGGDLVFKRDWKSLELDLTYCECKQFEDPSQPCRCEQEIIRLYIFSWHRKPSLSRFVIPMKAVIEQDP